MFRHFKPPAFILIFAAVVALNVSSFGQGQWTSVRSTNFHLIGNAQDKEIRRVATKLEQFRETLIRLFPSMKHDSPVPTTVVVFRNDRAFRPYKPLTAEGKPSEWVAGYFRPGEDANYIVLSTEKELQETFQTIYHEYVHYLMNNSFGQSKIPAWINEGLAEYYDQFAIEDDIKVTIGGLNNNHLATLQRSQLIPMDQFLRVDHYSLRQQGSHGANIFYAQAWAFVHFLIHGRDENRADQLNVFLKLIAGGEPDESAFARAFKSDHSSIERELRRYVEQRSFRAFQIKFKEKLTYEDKMVSEPLPEPSARAYLGDLLLGAERFDEAEAHLKDALAADPDSYLANTSLGTVKLRQRKFQEARKYLEQAIRSKNAGFIAHYRYAFMLSRGPMDEYGWVTSYPDALAAEMRASLDRAVKLNPRFPENYRLLAFISIVRGDLLDESIAHIRRAISLSPGNELYQLDMATLHSRNNEFEKASSIAGSVLKFAKDPSVKAHAENVLRNIEASKYNAELQRQVKERQERTGGLPIIIETDGKAPSAEEIAKLVRQEEIRELNRSVRKPKEGEVRVLGYLSRIDCSKGTIVFVGRTEGKELRLGSKDFQGLVLMTWVPMTSLEIGCNSVRSDLRAILTYVPAANQRSQVAGQLVAVELVPDYFVFIEGR